MKLKQRTSLYFFVVALIPTFFLGIISFKISERVLLIQTVDFLKRVSEIQKQRIIDIATQQITQVQLFTSRNQLRQLLRDNGQFQEETNLETIIIDAKNSVSFLDSISIISLTGETIASTKPSYKQTILLTPEQQKQAMMTFTIVDVRKNEKNIPIVQVTGPIIDNGTVIGIVNAEFFATALNKVVSDYESIGDTGDITLAKMTDYGDAIFITPLRHDTQAALDFIVKKEQTDSPIISALYDKETVVHIEENTIDYRGKPVIAVSTFIPGLNWGLVVKQDRSEIVAQLDDLKKSIALVSILIAIIIIIVSSIVSKIFTKPIEILKQFAQKITKQSFHERLPVTSDDELGELAKALNEMAENLSEFYKSLEQQVREKTQELESIVQIEEIQNKKLIDNKTAMINLMEDLSEEKVKILEEKTKIEIILKSITDGILVTDKTGKVVIINTAIEKLLQQPAKNIIGEKVTNLFVLINKNKQKIKKFERPIVKVLTSGKNIEIGIQDGVNIVVGKNKKNIPSVITVSPLIQHTQIVGAIMVIRDVTKEMEVDVAKTEFVSLASHQLRTPLSTINWYSEMLLAGDVGRLKPEQQEYVEEVYHGNQRMVALVNALLNVSRIEMGTFSIEPENANIIHILNDAIDDVLPQIQNKKIDIQRYVPKNMPMLKVDKGLVFIIFQNLISNAVKYTPDKGTVKIFVNINKSKKEINIKVSDTGYGIPKEQQKYIFTKLFRADNVKQLDTVGTGLGLYMAKSIVDHIDGKIWFESKIKKGTTFYVVLPLEGMKKKEGTRRLEVG